MAVHLQACIYTCNFLEAQMDNGKEEVSGVNLMHQTINSDNYRLEKFPTLSEIWSVKNIFQAYTFGWLNWNTESKTREGLRDQQLNIAVLSALLLTIWVALLFNTWPFEFEQWSDIAVGFSLTLATLFTFLGMINATILALLYMICSNDKTVQILQVQLGNNNVYPMFLLFTGGLCGVFAILCLIHLQYLRVTFYLSISSVIVFAFIINMFYFQYNIRALEITIEQSKVEKIV